MHRIPLLRSISRINTQMHKIPNTVNYLAPYTKIYFKNYHIILLAFNIISQYIIIYSSKKRHFNQFITQDLSAFSSNFAGRFIYIEYDFYDTKQVFFFFFLKSGGVQKWWKYYKIFENTPPYIFL